MRPLYIYRVNLPTVTYNMLSVQVRARTNDSSTLLMDYRSIFEHGRTEGEVMSCLTLTPLSLIHPLLVHLLFCLSFPLCLIFVHQLVS